MAVRAVAFIKGESGSPVSDGLGLAVSVLALAACAPVLANDPERYQGTALLLLPGLLLLAGAFGGRLAVRLHLPRLTGYLVIGALLGPDAWVLIDDWIGVGGRQVLDAHQVKDIKLVKDLAIGLIALMAGAEIRLAWLRARLRSVLALVGMKTLLVPGLIGLAVVLLADLFPFVAEAEADGKPLWLVGAVLGAIGLASSPMVVVSVIKDVRAKGPVAETAMGVAVVKDISVILLFTLAIALLGSDAAGSGSVMAEGGGTLAKLFFSLLLGLPIGWLLALITERGIGRVGWLVAGLALVVALLDPLLGIKPLFCLLAAGFVCENLWPRRSEDGSHRLQIALGRVAAPVFVLFFVAAGLGLQLTILFGSFLAVLVLVAVRLVAFAIAMRIGSAVGRSGAPVRRYGWMTMVPQAGVTLGLAAILEQRFPGWGESAASLVVACVAIHEFVGPIVLTWVLNHSGEADAA